MAKKNNSARKHSSPGLYFTDTVVNYATKSLGITSLGVVGETLRGRAFEPMTINDWAEYTYNFGGKSTEKFRGSQYPKYELPYIAQSYLEQSHNLKVVRVLGLSGVNAGPAWIATATGIDEYDNMAIFILRSRGEHQKAAFVSPANYEQGICEDQYEYDGIHYYAKKVTLEPSSTLNLAQNCNPGYSVAEQAFTVDSMNYGTFTIKVLINDEFANDPDDDNRHYAYYSVTLNPNDKNYIYNVIGGDPENGDAEVYVEELYDVALRQLVNEGEITAINQELVYYPNVNIVPQYEDVYDILTDPIPTRKMIGRRYLYSTTMSVDDEGNPIKVKYSTDNGLSWGDDVEGENGMIYTVMMKIDAETGKRSFFYGAYVEDVDYNYEYRRDYKIYPNSVPSVVSCTGNDTEDANVTLYGDISVNWPQATQNSVEYFKVGDGVCRVVTVEAKRGDLLPYCNENDFPTAETPDAENNYLVGRFVGKGENQDALHYVKVAFFYNGTNLKFDNESDISSVCANFIDGFYNDEYVSIENNQNISWIVWDGVSDGYEISQFSTVSLAQLFDWKASFPSENYSDNNEAFNAVYKDPSLISIKCANVKVYQKVATSVVPANITPATTQAHETERLTEFNFETDVDSNGKFTNCVRVTAQKSFYIKTTVGRTSDVYPITLDFNNYKEQYRWAMSPWIVSEMKGSAEKVELNKLFRFHSISDGSNATTEFKISIENIDPSTGRFDVVVRDFYDSDLSVNAYEKYLSCDLVPGSPNYIALKIGSTDGMYVSRSRYITVEVIENDVTKNSIPAGFLGYPVRDYSGIAITPISSGVSTVNPPYFRFNTNIDDDIKAKKQYFGVSDLVGIDEDIFKYKGVEAYDEMPNGLTPCFHLDARIQNGRPDSDGAIAIEGTEGPISQTVYVDGVTGYAWVTVGRNNTLPSYGIEPRIGDEATMVGTIYENKAYRKFTVAMYGGWDGWDYYRTIRSNGDEFRYKEYKGAIDSSSGYGTMFNVFSEPESLGFSAGDKVITSDYYAYLAGAKLLGNPKSVTVNVLATPGIDYVNNKALVDDVIDIVEDDRGDLIYVITTPDKPSGAGDTVDEMYTAEDVVYNLEDSDIDSNHCCTYYPWVKYYDEDNNQYLYLPLTRDVVRSIAYTDNVKFSWYANAGWNRGNIQEGAEPRKKLTINEQDTLYDGRINFVNSFAEEGNKIWGDKNLQVDDNLLNRISKRRLLLRIRTMLQNACIGLIFDPNDITMSQTVRSAVSKVLDDVKTGRGITDYKIEIDDSPETRDQLGLNVTYHIKPIKALEWINFTSVLTPEGMDWT